MHRRQGYINAECSNCYSYANHPNRRSDLSSEPCIHEKHAAAGSFEAGRGVPVPAQLWLDFIRLPYNLPSAPPRLKEACVHRLASLTALETQGDALMWSLVGCMQGQYWWLSASSHASPLFQWQTSLPFRSSSMLTPSTSRLPQMFCRSVADFVLRSLTICGMPCNLIQRFSGCIHLLPVPATQARQ